MTSEDQESLLANILKRFESSGSFFHQSFGYHIFEMLSQHERDAFPANAEFLFEMTEDVAEINVEKLAIFLHHDVIWMSICHTQYVSSNTVTCKNENINQNNNINNSLTIR